MHRDGKVEVHGTEVELARADFELLWLLVENVGQPVSREDYARHVQGVEYQGLERSLDTRMSRLRKALEAAGMPSTRIRTVRGQGYQLTRA